jgi:hypothetical protein
MIRTLATAAALVLALAGCAADERVGLREVTGRLAFAGQPPEAGAIAIEVHDAEGRLLARGEGPLLEPEPPIGFRLAVPRQPAGWISALLKIDGAARWRSAAAPVPAGGATDIGTLTLAAIDGRGTPGGAVAAGGERRTAGSPGGAAAPVGAAEEAAPDRPSALRAAGGDRPPAGLVSLRCGPDIVTADFTGAAVTLRVGATSLALEPVRAASGARYELPGDPETFLWSRGERALVGLAGIVLPECLPV